MDTCVRCGRRLTDPVSVEARYGPTCYRRMCAERAAAREEIERLMCSLKLNEQRDIELCRVNSGTLIDDPATNVPWSVKHHSLSGYEWGYAGSGPADLALNILNLFVPPGSDGAPPVQCYQGACSRFAWTYHQLFKDQFLTKMPIEGGSIRGETIQTWIDALRNQQKSA